MEKIIQTIKTYLGVMFYDLEFKYITYQDRDCLWGSDIHHMTSNNNLEDCNMWCVNNIYCGGFIAIGNRCHFKNKSCKNNLFESGYTTAFIPESNFIPDSNRKYIQI